jgi:hypothetical protein
MLCGSMSRRGADQDARPKLVEVPLGLNQSPLDDRKSSYLRDHGRSGDGGARRRDEVGVENGEAEGFEGGDGERGGGDDDAELGHGCGGGRGEERF